MAALLEKYNSEIIPAMQEKFQIKNKYAVSRLEKVVINMGVGVAIGDIKLLDRAVLDLAAISGQKPQICRAKKAVSNFRLRIDMPIGCKVTLRRAKMYEFTERLVKAALPRIRDFNGVPKKSFDKDGNYTLGLKDQSIFPEVGVTDRDFRIQGMDITFVFTGNSTEENREILRQLGMPFVK